MLCSRASVLCILRSQMCDWGFCAGLAATFPGDRPVSLLPQCHTIASTNLFRVLEKTCRSGDDPTCNSAGERERKNTLTNLKQKKRCIWQPYSPLKATLRISFKATQTQYSNVGLKIITHLNKGFYSASEHNVFQDLY